VASHAKGVHRSGVAAEVDFDRPLSARATVGRPPSRELTRRRATVARRSAKRQGGLLETESSARASRPIRSEVREAVD
jgi:hypothetical protein